MKLKFAAIELIQEIVRSIAKEYGWPGYPLA